MSEVLTPIETPMGCRAPKGRPLPRFVAGKEADQPPRQFGRHLAEREPVPRAGGKLD